jgi:hypothetical protein
MDGNEVELNRSKLRALTINLNQRQHDIKVDRPEVSNSFK